MRLTLPLCTTALACTVMLHAAAAGDERAAETLIASRAALGGPRLEAVTGLSATGAFRRMIGDREMEGDLVVDLAVPDRIRRTEHTGIPGGPSFSRTMALNGETFWSDVTNRGGGLMRFGGPDGPGASEADRERFRALQQRQLRRELERYLLVLLLRTSAPTKHGGTAEADDGTADVIEMGGDEQAPVRLFIDRQTHLPLMLSYTDVVPRTIRRGGPGSGPRGRPDPEQRRRLMQEPPREAAMELRLEDYRGVDGVRLPHRITRSVDGTPVEEWTIERFKVNPKFKPDTFEKP